MAATRCARSSTQLWLPSSECIYPFVELSSSLGPSPYTDPGAAAAAPRARVVRGGPSVWGRVSCRDSCASVWGRACVVSPVTRVCAYDISARTCQPASVRIKPYEYTCFVCVGPVVFSLVSVNKRVLLAARAVRRAIRIHYTAPLTLPVDFERRARSVSFTPTVGRSSPYPGQWQVMSRAPCRRSQVHPCCRWRSR